MRTLRRQEQHRALPAGRCCASAVGCGQLSRAIAPGATRIAKGSALALPLRSHGQGVCAPVPYRPARPARVRLIARVASPPA